tara:strand:+ start:28 stop:1269 length:1242 start_codon:yes stop_codon:yes gene_type:complete
MALTQVSTGGIQDGQVQTADIANAQITAAKLHADALDRTYTLGASGSDHYTFTGEGLTGAVNDPTLYLLRGKTYNFVNGNSGGAHPFRIQTTVNGSAGTEYNTGVTNNGGAGGSTIVFEVPHAAPDVLYYQCTSHGSMGGILYITGALKDGDVTTAKLAADSVTSAKIADDVVDSEHIAAGALDTEHIASGTGFQVSTNNIVDNAVTTAKITNGNITTAKIADDAITTAKIANNAVDTGQIATNSVTTLKLVDESVTLAKLEHGTSSNDGKFLRANNGADPTFETVSMSGGVPSGAILMWSGAENAIPTGYVLCNGQNSTPNLLARFVFGGGTGSGYSVGDQGGAATHTLTEAQMPAHVHHVYLATDTGTPYGSIYASGNNNAQGAVATTSKGSGAAHNNMPPYYVLCYIMKT